ncbi:MAG: hypothetical protein A2Z32_00120 [Chloroflexi bacterium RBG_16_69_14]|nr:MAG: hypothetical protein A2Z32_00120 [Chloroflexi bacterium RBG_16_69_14]
MKVRRAVNSRSAAALSVGTTSSPPSGVPAASFTTIAVSPSQPSAASLPPTRPSASSSWSSISLMPGSDDESASICLSVPPRSLVTETMTAFDGMCSTTVDVRFSVGPNVVSGLGAVASMTSASLSTRNQ